MAHSICTDMQVIVLGITLCLHRNIPTRFTTRLFLKSMGRCLILSGRIREFPVRCNQILRVAPSLMAYNNSICSIKATQAQLLHHHPTTRAWNNSIRILETECSIVVIQLAHLSLINTLDLIYLVCLTCRPVYLTAVNQTEGGASRGSSNSSSGSIPSTPRGPPRKPKQSGHALWVGNLPSGTSVGDLKDHFSREATRDIESVFLISKSNCAFVNYRTDTACAAAMHRFHDSRFQGVRLVCRLRRGPNPTSTATTPLVPGAPSGPSALVADALNMQSAPEAITQNRQISSRASEEVNSEAFRRGQRPERVPEKFFIMKSLTVEDMELSVRNKIWATQGHNEDALNKAYNVNLVPRSEWSR